MAISNYGELKTTINTHLFHQRFVAEYDNATIKTEAVFNRRLRVRQMEAVIPLTTALGDVTLPEDYLVWRSLRPVLAASTGPTFHPPYDELDYVHPAYLPPIGCGFFQVFTIEGNTLRVRPIDDRTNAFELHYYQKIPSLVGNDLNTNWLIAAYPDVYVEGLLVELAALGRNTEMAQLHKARRDELLQEIIQLSALTTGATSPTVRTAEYF